MIGKNNKQIRRSRKPNNHSIPQLGDGFALAAGSFGGIIALEASGILRALTNYDKIPQAFFKSGDENLSFGFTDGMLKNLPDVKLKIFKGREN